MKERLLSHFGLQPHDVPNLPPKLRNRLLSFLARWEAYHDLLDSVGNLNIDDLVSLQDLKIRALSATGKVKEAIQLQEKRIAQKFSLQALIQLGRLSLDSGDLNRAAEIAERVVQHNAEAGMSWGLKGDVDLARGALADAEQAYRHYASLSPRSQFPIYGLATVYLKRDDRLNAQAYGVRAFTVNEGDPDIPVPLLRDLTGFFETLADENRVIEGNLRLTQRLEGEIDQLKQLLQDRSKPESSTQKPARKTIRRQAPLKKRAGHRLPDLNAIPVSEQEKQEIEAAVKTHFGFPGLRPAQLQIIACSLRGEDVLAILPTGAGKSLTYQLPAIMQATQGLTLVISPLIALMKDQVDGLPDDIRGKALAINSSLSDKALKQAIRDIEAQKYAIVFAAPERLRQKSFVYALKRANISRFVIDEAHCVSTWGHDFRPDYLWISRAHRDLGSPPILALTATAPPLVREDIERQLFDQSSRSFRFVALDTYRTNLKLLAISASNADNKLGEVIGLCHQLPTPGIIYARSRANCEEIAAILRSQGLKAEHYHAGISNRSQVQERFMQGETDIIVATVAFGMGIDKSDIRFIVHYGLPNSIEAYYQEAGRAGRDGGESYCVLVHSSGDRGTLTRLTNNEALVIEFLRDVYTNLRRMVPVGECGPVRYGDIAQRVDSDVTNLRVAIGTLVRAGLIEEHYALPQEFTLFGTSQEKPPDPFKRFAQTIRLMPGQIITRNVRDLAAAAGVPLDQIEDRLYAWEDAGLLEATPKSRINMVTMLPPPADTAARIERLLDQYQTQQKQRIAEIGDYGKTGYCRHGFLSNYLGGEPRDRCDRCDNCVRSNLLPPMPELSIKQNKSDELIMKWTLIALNEGGWGRYNLIRLLQGDIDDNQRAFLNEAYGALADQNERLIKIALESMRKSGMIDEKVLSHGGKALGITPLGRKRLNEIS